MKKILFIMALVGILLASTASALTCNSYCCVYDYINEQCLQWCTTCY